MSAPIETIRAALYKMHARAMGDASQVYMSIPPDFGRDADMLLSGAIDELERLRAELAASHLAAQRMAVEAARDEREACAEVADEYGAALIADAIRARGSR